jgi:hypothetical protein
LATVGEPVKSSISRVGDGRLGAQQIRAARQSLVDDGERTESAAFEEVHDNRIAERLGEIAEKAVRAEVAADLLIVEDDPALGFQPIVFAARQEFS